MVRLTAGQTGKLSFKTEMNTPQKARVTAEPPGTLIMTGVNGDSSSIKSALTFETRVARRAGTKAHISRCVDSFSGGRRFGDADY